MKNYYDILQPYVTATNLLSVPVNVLNLHTMTKHEKGQLKEAIRTFISEGYLKFPDILFPTREQERLHMVFLCKYTRDLDLRTGLSAPGYFYACSKRFQLLERIQTPTCYNRTPCATNYTNIDSWFSSIFCYGHTRLTKAVYATGYFRKYNAPYQFPPATAKMLYTYFKPRSVLDPCFGWGDRFAAAVASPTIERFVGVDPRPGAAQGFHCQCSAYTEYVPDRTPMICNSSFIQSTMENAQLPNNSFDLAFTSPPYFNCALQTMTEHYKDTRIAETVDEYHNEILFPILKASFDKVTGNGHLVIIIKLADDARMEHFMRSIGAQLSFKIPFLYGLKRVKTQEQVYCWVKHTLEKTCQVCTKKLVAELFEKGRRICRKCISDQKRERAAAKNGAVEPHIDACITCGLAFDPTKFTWRKDVGRWRRTCHACTTPAAASAAYKKRLREHDEEAFKKARRDYMRDYRKGGENVCTGS